MISAVNSYNPNFCAKTKAAQKVARKIVKVDSSALKGISKTPMRLASNKDGIGLADASGFVCSGMGCAITASEITNMM